MLLDGSHVQLTWDMLRTRYRTSLRDAEPAPPGEIRRYELTGFPFVARRIAAGSRLRLYVGAPNSIYFQKNYNSGGVVAQEAGKDARVARVAVHHDRQHPSHVELPVVTH